MRGSSMTQDEINCREAVVSNDYQDLIINYSGRLNLLEFSTLACYQVVDDDFAVGYYYRPAESITDTVGSYSQMPKCCGLLQLQNLEELGITRLRRFESFDFYGQGIMIGLVDTGIDYSHPAFLQADGSSRVVAIWDQNDQEGTPPEGFVYGTEFTETEIAEGTAPKDELGHGTFLAGVAAGREDQSNNFTGIASQADIAVVKLKPAKTYLRNYYLLPPDVPAYSETDIMLGVRYLIELSIRRNQPLVLILGIGTNSGSHTASLPLCRYLDNLSYDLNLCIVIAAGNEGNARHHHSAQINREIQEVELQVGEEPIGFTMEFWTSAVSNINMTLVSPSGERAQLSRDAQQYQQRFSFVFERTAVFVRYEPQERNSSRRLVMFRFLKPSVGQWRLIIDGTEEIQGSYDIWLPMREFISEGTFFPVPDPFVTICEAGNTFLPITVGGYSSQTGGIYPATSRGYTATGHIKPTLVAPAVNIVGPFAGGGYVERSGTSIAAAYTAGCIALFWEYVITFQTELGISGTDTRWIGEQLYLDTTILRNLFAQGATREENRSYPNREEGYGKLNLFGVFEIFRSV